jgi:hypothetical protein
MAAIPEPPYELFERTPPGSPNTRLAFREEKNRRLRAALGEPPVDVDPIDHNLMKTRILARLQHEEAERLRNEAAAAANVAAAFAMAQVQDPTQPDPNVVVPRVGGVTVVKGVTVPWTGGNITHPRMTARGPYAYRPQDVKGRGKTRQILTTPIDKIFRLGVPMAEAHKPSVVNLFDWVGHIKRDLEQKGMDSIFYLYEGRVRGEVYLLEKYGRAKIEVVKEHVDDLKRVADDYDIENLELSAIFILNSLDIEMMRIIRAQVTEDASGPEVFAAVINYHQSLHEKAVERIIYKMSQLSITKEPAENVDTFSNKVLKYGKHIEAIGTDEQIAKLPKRIIDSYQETQSTVFNIYAAIMQERIYSGDDELMDWEKNVLNLKEKYRDLIAIGQWPAKKSYKEAQGLSASVKSKTGSKQKNSKALIGELNQQKDTRTCHHCGVVGHIRPNCPKKDLTPEQAKNDAATKSTIGNKASNSHVAIGNDPRRTAPTGDESPVRTRKDGTKEKWCEKCRFWTSGDKLHSTAEHKSRKPAVTFASKSAMVNAKHLGENDPQKADDDHDSHASMSCSSSDSSEGAFRFTSAFVGLVDVSYWDVDDCDCSTMDIEDNASDRVNENRHGEARFNSYEQVIRNRHGEVSNDELVRIEYSPKQAYPKEFGSDLEEFGSNEFDSNKLAEMTDLQANLSQFDNMDDDSLYDFECDSLFGSLADSDFAEENVAFRATGNDMSIDERRAHINAVTQVGLTRYNRLFGTMQVYGTGKAKKMIMLLCLGDSIYAAIIDGLPFEYAQHIFRSPHQVQAPIGTSIKKFASVAEENTTIVSNINEIRTWLLYHITVFEVEERDLAKAEFHYQFVREIDDMLVHASHNCYFDIIGSMTKLTPNCGTSVYFELEANKYFPAEADCTTTVNVADELWPEPVSRKPDPPCLVDLTGEDAKPMAYLTFTDGDIGNLAIDATGGELGDLFEDCSVLPLWEETTETASVAEFAADDSIALMVARLVDDVNDDDSLDAWIGQLSLDTFLETVSSEFPARPNTRRYMADRTGNVHRLDDDTDNDRRVRFRLADDNDQEVEITHDMDIDEFNLANNGLADRRALQGLISFPADDSSVDMELDLPYNGFIDNEAWMNFSTYGLDNYADTVLETSIQDDADRAIDADDDTESEIDFEGENDTAANNENRSVWNNEDGEFSSMYLNKLAGH